MSLKSFNSTCNIDRRNSCPEYPLSLQDDSNIHFDTLQECPSSRPEWPKTITTWWSPSSPKEKPPYSYATLIAHAILTSEEGRLTLNDIYIWISDNYTAYSVGAGGWQNSIRHNLSLNKKWFRKIERKRTQANGGKGAYWTLVAGAEKVFIENLTLEGPQQAKRNHGNVTKGLGSRRKRFPQQNKNVTPNSSYRSRYKNDYSPSDSFYSTFRVGFTNPSENLAQRKRSIDSQESDSDDNDSSIDVNDPFRNQCRTTRAYSVDSLFASLPSHLDQENYTDNSCSPLIFTTPYWQDDSDKLDLYPVNNDILYPPFAQYEFVSMQQVLYS